MDKTDNKLLYDALVALSSLQKKGRPNTILRGMSTLGEEYTRVLLDAGFLMPVIKGWYIPSKPGSEKDSTIWYASFWDFISSYMSSKHGDDWSLTPETSLYLHGGGTVVPGQIVVRSTEGMNNIQNLIFGCSVLEIRSSVPTAPVIHEGSGCRMYSVEEALLLVAPDYYERNRTEAMICLSQIRDESQIIGLTVEHKAFARCSKLCGALAVIGKGDLSGRIVEGMKRLGYRRFKAENPFTIEGTVHIERTVSPQAARLPVLWEKMRADLLAADNFSGIHPHEVDEARILKNMDDNYVLDSYHSLSIEGYAVTEALLERVRSGAWSPDGNEEDKNSRNALVARGYYLAYESVKASVSRVIHGRTAGDVFASDHRDWHYRLFEPFVTAGIIEAKDLIGYRNQPVYIRGSRHVPANFQAVPECMDLLSDLMRKESNPLVRAVLGHFFFTFVHPYMDGNGRTARFAMNTQLVTAGYEWIVVPSDMRQDYMSALEKASVDEDIVDFGQIVSFLLRNPIARKAAKSYFVPEGDEALVRSIPEAAPLLDRILRDGRASLQKVGGRWTEVDTPAAGSEYRTFYVKDGRIRIYAEDGKDVLLEASVAKYLKGMGKEEKEKKEKKVQQPPGKGFGPRR